jgi:hypothetical protein
MTQQSPAPPADPFAALFERLQSDCTAAEQAERDIRASVDAQIKAAETARAFAWRRLNALRDMARVAAAESEAEASIERQLAALFREIGWIEGGLGELGEGAQPLIDKARPIAQALHVQAHPPAPREDGGTPPPVAPDPVAAFRAFEAWYEAERGQPFLKAYERYVPPTPVVEF